MKSYQRSKLRLLSGTSIPELAHDIARKVGVNCGNILLKKFSNKETHVELLENVRSQHVYILQSGCGENPNDNLMELLFMINTCRLSSAASITVIMPLFPYSKADQKDGFRVPITCKLVADFLKRAGANDVMVLDPHTPQLEGFFDIPIAALKTECLFCEWIRRNVNDWSNCIVVSPDEGGVKRSVSLANDLGLEFALIHSRYKRSKPNILYEDYLDQNYLPTILDIDSLDDNQDFDSNISGNVSGRNVLLMDDIIDTGNTIMNAIKVLKREKALSVYILSVHGVFSDNALEKMMKGSHDFIQAIVVTNSIAQKSKHLKDGVFNVLDVSGLIAEFIRRHYFRESVSVLSQFMPILKETTENTDSLTKNKALTSVQCIKNETISSDHEKQKLRKGFRLSSVCWD